MTEAAPAPASLGALKLTVQRGFLEVGTIAGSCSETLDVAYADLTLELAASALPFRSVLAYQWLVDGAPYDGFFHILPHGDDGNGSSDLGRGLERVYALCEPTSSRKPDSLLGRNTLGEHRVSLRGVLRGGATVETPELHFELKCDGPAPISSDAGTAAGGGRVLPRNTDLSSEMSTAATTDAGSTANATLRPTSADGCSIAHAPRPRAAWWMLAFPALALGLARRRARAVARAQATA